MTPGAVPASLWRMAVDRSRLARTPGLTFAKLVGTGDGRTFTVRDADPLRWGIVAVWDRPDSLHRFEATSPVHRAWSSLARERWRIDLVALRSRGQWAGREAFATRDVPTSTGPIAAVTRARLRWREARHFWSAVPPVSADLQNQQGLRFAIGIGEAPIGLQGTFSIWDSPGALNAFAYTGAPHRLAISETQRRDWYREELFARFLVIGSTGTVDGIDPAAVRADADA